MSARDDALREVAAEVHAPALGREVAIAIEAEDHRDPVDLDRDHVPGPDLTGARDGSPGLAHRVDSRRFRAPVERAHAATDARAPSEPALTSASLGSERC